MAVQIVSAERAVAEVRRGDTVMVGGFGLVGAPLTLIDALVASDEARDLTVISNNLGEPGRGLGALLLAGRVKRAIGSYFTSNPDVVAAHERGDLDAELLPQGTLSEAIRSGGAGLGGFYTPTGVGTKLADGREEREIGGARYLFHA
jgi:3-oxoacid CoA-transferase A subunit